MMAYLTVEKQISYFPIVFRNAIKNLFNLKFSYFWVTNRGKLCINKFAIEVTTGWYGMGSFI